jgi:hypothetical protein
MVPSKGIFFFLYSATDRGGLVVSDLLDFRHYKGDRSAAKRTGRLYPRRNPWYSFSEPESTSGHMVFSEGCTEKITSDTTGDRSRDRPTSSTAVGRNTSLKNTVTPPEIDPRNVRTVEQRLNHYATPGSLCHVATQILGHC